MGIRESIARKLGPILGLKTDAEYRATMAEEINKAVSEQITRARMDMPISVNYDPKNEGYRRTSDSIYTRNLMPVQQARMFEIAYYMFDASAMFRRLATMDRGFLFSGPVVIHSDSADVKALLDRFWTDPENNMALNYPEWAMWLSILGELLLTADVNPINGFVRINYEDPSLIKDVWVNPLKKSQIMQVEMMGENSRQGKRYPVIRKDYNINSRTYDRLVGECFFVAINKPPSASRGRSDFMTLVDWIDSLERYGYNYLERAEFLMNFVWDITLKGMDQNQITEWLRNNPPPEPGSQRAHNEQVEWNAVSPDLKATDFKSGFDMGKAFIMGAAGRPESWFGSGGKQYQTEADQSGQAPVVDLEQRQGLLKYVLEQIFQFVIDQAVSHQTLSETEATQGFKVTMPEISKKDLAKFTNAMPQLTTALAVAVTSKFIRRDTAIRIFSFVAGYLGYEVDAQAEIDAATNELDDSAKDYEAILKKYEEAQKNKGTGNGE